MKTLLVLNDYTPEAEHALAYSIMLASGLHTRILVWNLREQPQHERQFVKANTKNADIEPSIKWLEKVKLSIGNDQDYEPSIHFLTEMETLTKGLHELVISNNVDLVIRGISSKTENKGPGINVILKKTHCPLMLISEETPLTVPENIFYLTDLRFCRREVVSFAKKISDEFNSHITIAHCSDPDLPNLNEKYASILFKDTVAQNNKQHNISFTYVKDRDFKRVTDVLINTLHARLLLLESKSAHFKALTSKNRHMLEFAELTVPVVIFPS